MRRRVLTAAVAGTVVLVTVIVAAYWIANELKWRDYVENDLEFFLTSYFVREGRLEFDYQIEADSGSMRECLNPLTGQRVKVPVYRIVPGPYFQKGIDSVNDELSASSAKRGDIFAAEVLGVDTYSRVPRALFHGSEDAIEKYRVELNKYDGKTKRLTIDLFEDQPALGMLITLYSDPEPVPGAS